MDLQTERISLWKALKSHEPHILLRLGVSVAAGMALAGLALIGAWLFASSRGARWIRDEHLGAAFALATLGWFTILLGVWLRIGWRRRLLWPTVASGLTIGAAVIGSFAVDAWLRPNEEILIVAICLLTGAAVLGFWLPALHAAVRGRRVVGTDNLVQVGCPECGYSLIGLRELRCPECGTEFTIDGLIRAQNYDGGRRSPAHADAADAGQPSRNTADNVLSGEA